MWETPSYTLVILLVCVVKLREIQAQCERPLIGGNRILADDSSLNVFPEGSTLTYKCSTGYIPAQSTSSRTITCKGKEWTELELQCTGRSCGNPGEIANGEYLTPGGIRFGAVATAVCHKGFRLSGPETRNCRDFGWDGRTAECEAVKCSPPPSVEHGTYDPVEEVYDYNQGVTYTCSNDYTLLGEPTILCYENGSFPRPPKCSLVKCETPIIENAERVEGKRPPYGYRNAVRYQCDKGFKMLGSASLVCLENGWSLPFPTCISDKIDPKPSPIPGTPSPPDDSIGQKTLIGIVVGVLLAVFAVVAAICVKKRARWGKVPSVNDGNE